jgi:glycosyltransferase involved in cell wall biosynthesis
MPYREAQPFGSDSSRAPALPWDLAYPPPWFRTQNKCATPDDELGTCVHRSAAFTGKYDLNSSSTMQQIQELRQRDSPVPTALIPVSVIVPVRNEAKNLPRCLESLRHFAEVYVVDSQSTDETVEIARTSGAKVVQFHYRGGWPKKRQWAMDTLPLACDWVLLIDADEVVTEALADEIRRAVEDPRYRGYYLALRMYFLGRQLRFCGARFWKLSLFRRGMGRFECRLLEQDESMADMEIHEHVVVDGPTSYLKEPLTHHNEDSLSRYIRKHDEYSNWESQVLLRREGPDDLPPALFGSQAQQRRWLKKKFFAAPGSSVLLFLYRYLLRLGFLDGIPGLIYCGFQAVQMFHTKSKIYELRCGKE